MATVLNSEDTEHFPNCRKFYLMALDSTTKFLVNMKSCEKFPYVKQLKRDILIEDRWGDQSPSRPPPLLEAVRNPAEALGAESENHWFIG